MLPHLIMPAHHDVRAKDVIIRRLHGTLAAAAERGPADFAELLLVPGVGARTVESLAMVAEVVHGAPCRFSDPARFSLAHGGKDRHPYPVPIRVYDETIRVLKSAVSKARLGRDEELRRDPSGSTIRPASSKCVATGRRSTPTSPASGSVRRHYDGRSVFGWEADHPEGRRSPRRLKKVDRRKLPLTARRAAPRGAAARRPI